MIVKFSDWFLHGCDLQLQVVTTNQGHETQIFIVEFFYRHPVSQRTVPVTTRLLLLRDGRISKVLQKVFQGMY